MKTHTWLRSFSSPVGLLVHVPVEALYAVPSVRLVVRVCGLVWGEESGGCCSTASGTKITFEEEVRTQGRCEALLGFTRLMIVDVKVEGFCFE